MMESVLEKESFMAIMAAKMDMGPGPETHAVRTGAGLVVGLIEIREAIEELTRLQRVTLDREQKNYEQGLELLKEWEETREYLDVVAGKANGQTELIAGVVSTLGQHARLIQALAEEKQDRVTVLNGPDTGGPG